MPNYIFLDKILQNALHAPVNWPLVQELLQSCLEEDDWVEVAYAT